MFRELQTRLELELRLGRSESRPYSPRPRAFTADSMMAAIASTSNGSTLSVRSKF